ncbi:MAG: MarR family winged helix-turn-helix transcriptional regulator [Ilumatobacteraceae bacterium]
MDEVRWLDENEEQAWRALQFMQMQLTGRLARDVAASSGLSYPDYVVLVALTDRPDGRMRAFELGRELGWEQSRVSHHVARMVGRGLVAYEKCEFDKRGAFVVITASGRDAIEKAAPGHLAMVRRLFIDVLTPTQLDAIGSAATAVLEALDGDRSDGDRSDRASAPSRRTAPSPGRRETLLP